MKYCRKWWAAGLLLCAAGLHAELGQWVQHLAIESGLRDVFFRPMVLPAGVVDGRRPPRETMAALGERIAKSPREADLYRLRASEAELALAFTSAEADWKTYAQLRSDPIALADFYHRRLRPLDEIAALDRAGTNAAFARAIEVAKAQALPETAVIAQYRAWIARYPLDAGLRKQFIRYMVDTGHYTSAEREIVGYRQAFPNDESVWIEEAGLTLKRGTVNQAIAVFERQFRPLMPDDWLKGYFDLLQGQGRLRDFLAAARTEAQAQPESLDAAARLFYYWRQQANPAAARRVLIEYRGRKKNWTAEELFATARLFEMVQEYDEAARQYYALYSLPAADDTARERGLAGLAGVLLNAPEQPVRFGAGDLSLYRDIATMDRHPGFLNGILSLVLNTTSPGWQYNEQNRVSVAYFHRARASELLELLDNKFPKCAAAPALHSKLIEACLAYGDNEGVVRAGRKFLLAYRDAPERNTVALWMGDAFARMRRTRDEFALYDQLLGELAAKAGGMPLGNVPPAAEPQPEGEAQQRLNILPRAAITADAKPSPARSPGYERVLDRYVARLVSLERVADALALYRREIDRNPNDPGLFEKLAAFLNENHLADAVEQTYQRAAARFPQRSWHHRLARWYLRLGRDREFAELTRQVVKIFSGTELERYFGQVVGASHLDPALYRQLNVYAHERFPDDLVFVKNLLAAYARKETADPAAYTNLLRNYWFYDDQLRARLFEWLSHAGTLEGQLAGVSHSDPAGNPAAAQFYAEGQAWRSHFEEAAPVMRALAGQFPGSRDLVLRASSLERSLGNTDAAAALARRLTEIDPRDSDSLARVGDIYAESELFARARPWWDRMPRIEPGKAERYLEAATVFWDYYKYDDALRLIREARVKLKQPALFAYEAGAIYEGKREFANAIREYMQGAAENSPAQARLLELAQRPARRAQIDPIVAAAPLRLRAAVLESEKRRQDLEALLRSSAGRETSLAGLVWVEQNAGRLGFGGVEELSLERQAAITHDPVERLRLRLALVRRREQHGQIPAAESGIAEIARANPAILGVVRAATDFYWRNAQPDKAIDTLVHAAATANPEYRRQFTYEAARKATEARQFARARQLLEPLLAAAPFDAQYLAAMAATYGLAGDDAGLRDFYRAKIELLKQAPLAADDRMERIAGLRRGLIPALDRLGDAAGAVDQYIEVIKRYPEDQGLIREAATYAATHALSARLIAYYTKAGADSPRDFRWPMVLARLQTHAENFDAAVAAYTRAIAVRPDRTDLYLSRGALEERLMRFAEAEQTYRKVWDLSYRDPQWLEKVAELEARQGKVEATVATLREAWLEARQERPDTLMAIARRLDSWGLVDQALPFAERAATGKLDDSDVATYARLMTRVRRYPDVLAGYTDRPNALAAMAEAVDEFYTPEEKAAFAAALEKSGGPAGIWIATASRAGLHDLEARWRAQQLMTPGAPQYDQYQLVELQKSRFRFEELGRQMEALAAANKDDGVRSTALANARAAYRAAGDVDGLARVFSQDHNDPQFLQLLARRDSARLVQLASTRNDAADVAIASGSPKLAFDAIAARGRTLPPVWSGAYTGLAGLYYWRTAPDVTEAFRAILGPAVIGDRLGKAVDRTRQLAGDQWFYYGSRFGEYLSLRGAVGANDYLPAAVEGRTADATAYAELGDWFAERGDGARALEEYEQALELDADHGAVQDRIAVVLWNQGRREDAVAHWKLALAAFEAQQGRPNLQESFWMEAPAALENIGQRGLGPRLQGPIDSLFASYEKRHESYRLNSLLDVAVKYGMIDLATQPEYVLEQLSYQDRLSARDRIGILRRLIELRKGALPPNAVEQDQYVSWRAREVYQWRVRIAGLLFDSGDPGGARKELAAIPDRVRMEIRDAVPLELRIASKAGTLDALLETYRQNPQTAPNVLLLRAAAFTLREKHENAAAARVLEFACARELDRGSFAPENFLGLAEVRLESGAAADAVRLLQRMQLISGQPFENLVPAADLLEKFNHSAEAREFLLARVKAVPWDIAARVRVNQELEAIVVDAKAPYRDRVNAARRGARNGTGELALLGRGNSTPAEAEQPYYYDARLVAAGNRDAATRLRLLLDAVAIRPQEHAPLVPLLRAALDARRDQLAVTISERAAVPEDFLRDLVTACVRIGDDAHAARLLQGRKGWERELAPIEVRLALAAKNNARRPVVSDRVEQSRAVRPRLEP